MSKPRLARASHAKELAVNPECPEPTSTPPSSHVNKLTGTLATLGSEDGSDGLGLEWL